MNALIDEFDTGMIRTIVPARTSDNHCDDVRTELEKEI